MKKLLELLAIKPTAGDFGIEIEMEGNNLAPIDDAYWYSTIDNSLRNGMEYIFKKPVRLELVPKMVKYLKKHLDNHGAKVDFSFRTSVHAHMNVQELTFNQVLNVIYTYLLIEAPLMEFCGVERKGNRFCLRLEDAEGAMETFHHMFADGEISLKIIPADGMRYAAINIEALLKYGSLEFRAMHGTLDADKLHLWCTVLHKIREFACLYDNPTIIYDIYTKKEAEGFFNSVLGNVADKFRYGGLVKDIQKSFSLSLDLPFAYLARSKKVVKKGKDKMDVIYEEFVNNIPPVDGNKPMFVRNVPAGEAIGRKVHLDVGFRPVDVFEDLGAVRAVPRF